MKKHVVSLQRVLYIIGNSLEISITLKCSERMRTLLQWNNVANSIFNINPQYRTVVFRNLPIPDKDR